MIGNAPFAMLWGDELVDAEVPCLAQLAAVFDRFNASVGAFMRVPQEDIPKYGVARAREVAPRTFVVDELVEKPPLATAPSDLAAVKEYILTPDVFEELERTPPGQGGEIWLTDALNRQAARGGLYGYEFEGRRYDIGSKQEFLEATVELALKRPDLGPTFRAYLRSLNL